MCMAAAAAAAATTSESADTGVRGGAEGGACRCAPAKSAARPHGRWQLMKAVKVEEAEQEAAKPEPELPRPAGAKARGTVMRLVIVE